MVKVCLLRFSIGYVRMLMLVLVAFRQITALKKHIIHDHVHAKPATRHVCTVDGCRKAYTRRADLKEHTRRRHPGSFVPRTCDSAVTSARQGV